VRVWRIGMAQLNTTVGDLPGNAAKVREALGQARSLGVDLVAFPELTITGYPPEDLLLKPSFISDNIEALRSVLPETVGLTAVIGFVDRDSDIYNAAAVAYDGKLVGVYHKIFLPNYGVFDEDRYFQEGTSCPVFVIEGVKIGVSICEDIWYPTGPASVQAANGAQLLVNINGSPFHAGKHLGRERMLATRAADNGFTVCYVNLVGGQDELVFDGNSLLIDPYGETVVRGRPFVEELVVADVDLDTAFRQRLHAPLGRKMVLPEEAIWSSPQTVASLEARQRPRPALPAYEPAAYDRAAEVYQALVVGTRDYVRKNRFEQVIIGVSGGIDSSLVATIATDALGADAVMGISNPSQFSSEGSIADARQLATNLGITFHVIPIADAYQAYERMLDDLFHGTPFGTAEENVQSRIRGNIWMAVTNKFGGIVLAAGNKSEMACGYATLYGDMAGGFAVIKDVPKTLVYDLARYRNAQAGYDLIPEAVLTKAPSAELRPNQLDTDTLPPYEILDPILEKYVEQDWSAEEIIADGADPVTVRRIIAMVDRNEYKRRQSPPGIKITPRNFGRDRRMPITNRYRP